ncbi:hypothetical protein NDU88_001055 [Pleurodeles waltl]|uniref:Uncharacterized protein n=1 Tax=Pleurodeles waltl TaxID=8319 RepID=A0AAV7WJB7_PLEWA|nr:hypothetical protein NDU88_001055 [Pleurodeles waltl]
MSQNALSEYGCGELGLAEAEARKDGELSDDDMQIITVCCGGQLPAGANAANKRRNEVLDYSVANREKPYFILGRYA